MATYCKRGFTFDATDGIGNEAYDQEGRVIMTDHSKFVLFNVYFPNGGREGRLNFKLDFYNAFKHRVSELQKTRKVIVVGDVNTAHTLLDIHRDKVHQLIFFHEANMLTDRFWMQDPECTGFLPSERQWIDEFLGLGYVDSFRHFHPGVPKCYTWWDPKTFSRSKNKGWRLFSLL